MEFQITVTSDHLDQIEIGKLRAKWSAAGDRILRFYIDIRQIGLNLHKEVSATDIGILQNKVETIVNSWDAKYVSHLKKKEIASSKNEADTLTQEAEDRRTKLRNILSHTLAIDDAINWDQLKSNKPYVKEPFGEPTPMKPRLASKPVMRKVSFLASIFGAKKKAEQDYQNALEAHQTECERIKRAHQKDVEKWEKAKSDWEQEQKAKLDEYLAKQNSANEKVNELKDRWEKGDPEAIVEHASLVLENSDHDELISKDFAFEILPEERTLLVEYGLPSPDDLPDTKSIRFIASRGELKETKISVKERKDLYDDVCYQLCLRCIHELLEADTLSHIEKIGFNGVTTYIDRAIGQRVTATILSVLVDRDQFMDINLSNVDPKTCFKSLKGVSAASLAGLSPIAPIIKLKKDDRRFIDAKRVEVDDSTNLAAMNWEEFEHLVRELFDKEFVARGGEVRVTQSSSDGGVDAVAFDPDPISGGKIIIQAKRYTKTVGVAAVRDLYGTTLNEGAIKGILVTTSDYGPDAYRFAADKPLTLMSGANLLHLLKKHGINAKIDVKEARKYLGLE